MAEQNSAVYELRRDWGSPPFFKGTAAEVAEEARGRVNRNALARGHTWKITVNEKPDRAIKTVTNPITWTGTIIGVKPEHPDDPLDITVRHNRHDSAWDGKVKGLYNQLAKLNKAPELDAELLALSAADRKWQWRERRKESEKLYPAYIKELNRRDVLANERLVDIAQAFMSAGDRAEYEELGRDDWHPRGTLMRGAEWFEGAFQFDLQQAQKAKLLEQNFANPKRSLYKGYIQRPDGSHKRRTLSQSQVRRMYETNDFSPPKVGQRDRSAQGFPTKKGI